MMTKQVTVEELKNQLDDVLAQVEDGATVSIVQEGREIAELRPKTVLRVYRADPGRLQDVPISPMPAALKIDPAQVIIEERERERAEKKWRA